MCQLFRVQRTGSCPHLGEMWPGHSARQRVAYQDNPYANLLVAKDTEVNDPRVRKLEQLLHSPPTLSPT